MMTCRNCQAHLVAYLHNELSPHLRRRVAYHLDDCPVCYAVYVWQRDLARDLQNAVPLIGRGSQPRLNRVWAAVQADLAQPRRTPLFYQARYGLAMLAAALTLLFPWVFSGHDVTLAAPPTQPAPLLAVQTAGVTAPLPAGTAVALSVTLNDGPATPEAQPRGLPAPGATAAPDDEGL
ncbi:MAG: zf-HC2 domain-containing protein [Chloroflexi bacterium]|nr:zf-HC2 domain-containing protein [Chloroflexota bacterium]